MPICQSFKCIFQFPYYYEKYYFYAIFLIVHSEGYLVSTSGCVIPEYKIDHPSIAKFKKKTVNVSY